MIYKIFTYLSYFISLAWTVLDRIIEPTRYQIKKTDIVLDVGAGNRPLLRSDFVLDKYFFADHERPTTGYLFKSKYRYLVVGDCTDLPFKDKAFDFLYCKNLVEHVENIDKFFAEIQRVAKRGVIIAPSVVGEIFDNQNFHCWLIDKVKNELIFKPKKGVVSTEINNFIKKMVSSKNISILIFFRMFYGRYFEIRYLWKATLNIEN